MIASYWPDLDQPSVSKMMWRRVADRPLERRHRLVQPGEDVRLAVGPDTGDLALEVTDPAERLRPDDPVRGLVEGHDAELVAFGHGRGRPQDRFLADVDLLDAADAARGPARLPPLNVLQWQAAIEPDWSMTTTSAISGCFWRSFTPMSTGSVSSSAVFW